MFILKIVHWLRFSTRIYHFHLLYPQEYFQNGTNHNRNWPLITLQPAQIITNSSQEIIYGDIKRTFFFYFDQFFNSL